VRDTSTARVLATDLRAFAVDDALPTARRVRVLTHRGDDANASSNDALITDAAKIALHSVGGD